MSEDQNKLFIKLMYIAIAIELINTAATIAALFI